MKDKADIRQSKFQSRFISHRGNLDGSVPELENKPDYLLAASKLFVVEVDVWYTKGSFFTGHDSPKYEVDSYFIQNESFLLHAKNVETIIALKRLPNLEVFYQDSNLVACTTTGRIIFHEEVKAVDLNRFDVILVDINAEKASHGNNCAVLTDYPNKLSNGVVRKKNPFDVLVLDIDGVLTNGTKLYSPEGFIIGKRFNDRDFTAIKRFLTEGVDVVFLSGDKTVNEAMAKNRGIEFIYSKSDDGNIDKSVYVDQIRRKYDAQVVAYIGDDFYDLSGMAVSDFSFCPSDASSDVKRFADQVLSSGGGNGVVAELFDLYFSKRATRYPHDYIKSRFI